MKLVFSVPFEQLNEQKDRILSQVQQCFPGAVAQIDVAAGVLTVEIRDGMGVTPDSAADILCQRLYAIGVTATRTGFDHTYGQYQGGARQAPAPIQFDFKKPRTVRLPVFLVSLVAVALVFSILAFSFGSLLSGGLFADHSLGTGEEQSEDYVEKIALIDYIFKQYGLYDTDGQLLLDEMLKAYAAATGDKYAAYYTDEELQSLLADMQGTAVGIGVMTTYHEQTGGIVILQVIPESPAEKAGVLPGDVIVAIGKGESIERVSEIGFDLAMQKLLGEAGTKAEFTVLRNSAEIEFSITREAITSISVSGGPSITDKTVGVVRISGFDANTPAQFKNVMNTLIEGGCTRFVYDVRNNPGGEQKSVMAVLSYFLEENDTIMSIVTKDGSTTYYRAEEATYEGEYAACSVKKEEIGMYRQYPIAVLTNGYTASAGELFTAVLSEYELATLVGENTYGKGVIQTIYDLSELGFSGGLKLTIGYYAPPSGVNYDGKGIAPDIAVTPDESIANKNFYLLTEQEDNQLLAAIEAVLAK